jgi:membrane-bound lytic murein transglycosylase F
LGRPESDSSTLRVVVGPEPTPLLPGFPADPEREIARALAAASGRPLELVLAATGEDPMDRLLAGEVDVVATGLDASRRPADRVAYSLPYRHENHPVVLALRTEDVRLRADANEILIARAFTDGHDTRRDDLAGIRRRGSLRFLARPHPASYTLRDGDPCGFEYELLERFASEQGLALEIVTPPDPSYLEAWLLAGRGDVLAASPEGPVAESGRARLTRPVVDAEMAVVSRDDDPRPVRELGDLAGRTLAVRESGAERALAEHVAAAVEGLRIELVPERTSLVQVLAGVGDGRYDLALAPTHLLRVEQLGGRRLACALPLGDARLGWSVRAGNRELLAALDDFLARERGGAEYNFLRRKYFASGASLAAGPGHVGRISPFDAIARRYAAEYDLDWRLIVAQMCQESRFDPRRVSPAGAAGLMQMTPETAARLDAGDLHDPDQSIRAGTRYLRRLIDVYEPTLPLATRIRFALASYDAGPGHVLDARALAREQGLDPDRWYGNVEKAVLLLEQPEYYEKAKRGRCRGSECVRYVAEIDRRYRLYVQTVPEPAGREPYGDGIAALPAGPASPLPPA